MITKLDEIYSAFLTLLFCLCATVTHSLFKCCKKKKPIAITAPGSLSSGTKKAAHLRGNAHKEKRSTAALPHNEKNPAASGVSLGYQKAMNEKKSNEEVKGGDAAKDEQKKDVAGSGEKNHKRGENKPELAKLTVSKEKKELMKKKKDPSLEEQTPAEDPEPDAPSLNQTQPTQSKRIAHDDDTVKYIASLKEDNHDSEV